ncbi:hypothetical protein RRF57_003076 [Xylaria bambusicola]|uniref:Uncharacterized protein n=1 Tax=Xylaria bambusicola TaxID=326684 RepID=A0AAN7UJQ0_9PEZI
MHVMGAKACPFRQSGSAPGSKSPHTDATASERRGTEGSWEVQIPTYHREHSMGGNGDRRGFAADSRREVFSISAQQKVARSEFVDSWLE